MILACGGLWAAVGVRASAAPQFLVLINCLCHYTICLDDQLGPSSTDVWEGVGEWGRWVCAMTSWTSSMGARHGAGIDTPHPLYIVNLPLTSRTFHEVIIIIIIIERKHHLAEVHSQSQNLWR